MKSKQEQYQQLATPLSALLAGEHDLIANSANFTSFIFRSVPDLNWAGVYFVKDGELVLGPFQGKPARVRIPFGQGVWRTRASKCETAIVADVHALAGHIACDRGSTSEIGGPLMNNPTLVGVLDLDSPSPSRFDREDAEGLEMLA